MDKDLVIQYLSNKLFENAREPLEFLELLNKVDFDSIYLEALKRVVRKKIEVSIKIRELNLRFWVIEELENQLKVLRRALEP